MASRASADKQNQLRHFPWRALRDTLIKLSILPPSNYAPTLVMHRRVAGSAVAIRAPGGANAFSCEKNACFQRGTPCQGGEASPREATGKQTSHRPLCGPLCPKVGQ